MLPVNLNGLADTTKGIYDYLCINALLLAADNINKSYI